MAVGDSGRAHTKSDSRFVCLNPPGGQQAIREVRRVADGRFDLGLLLDLSQPLLDEVVVSAQLGPQVVVVGQTVQEQQVALMRRLSKSWAPTTTLSRSG